MTDNEMNTLAKLVSSMVINKLEAKQKQWDTELVQELKTFEPPINKEEKLLTNLAEAMTALDYNLKLENYTRCSQLQDEIKDIENQLKNLK